jgi:antitoxin MazE
MDAVISKWGNSLAIRLPMALVNEVRFKSEQKVSISAKDGRIVIEPMQKVAYTLDDLVAGMTAKNAHREVSVGAPVGKEVL